MIKNFQDKETEKIFNRQRSRKLPSDIQQIALRKLRMLNRSQSLQDLRVPSSNRLEKVSVLIISGVFALFGKIAMPTTLRLSIITENS